IFPSPWYRQSSSPGVSGNATRRRVTATVQKSSAVAQVWNLRFFQERKLQTCATSENSVTAQKYAIPQSIAAATNFTGIASSVQSSKKFSDAAKAISAASAIEKRISWPRRIRFLSAKLTDLDSLGSFHGSRLQFPAATRNAL